MRANRAVIRKDRGQEQDPNPVLDYRADVLPPRGRNLRRALRFVTCAWFFGAVWFASLSGAPITLFAQSLGASKFIFGLLSAIPFLAALFASPLSVVVDKTGKRRPIFLVSTYVQRMLWIPIAIFPLWILNGWGDGAKPVALGIFLLLLFLMYFGGSVGGPAWTSWMADIVPDRARGRYIGRRRSWGMLTGIPAAILSGILLDRIFPHGRPVEAIEAIRWCGYLFIAASLVGIWDVALHHWVPDVPVSPHPHSFLSIFSRPLHDPQFLWFAGFVGTITFAVSFMNWFSALYLLEKLDAGYTQTQLILLAVPYLAQLLVLAAWGRAVDRMGKRPVMALAGLGLVPVGFAWVLMNGGAIWLGYLLTAVGAALYCGVEVANSNMVLEMSGRDDARGTAGSSYVAVNNIVVNISGGLGGISAGIIAQVLQHWNWNTGIPGLKPIGFYEVLFVLSGVMRLLAVVVFLPRLREPDARPAHHALMFMTTNIYNNLVSMISLPIRTIASRQK